MNATNGRRVVTASLVTDVASDMARRMIGYFLDLSDVSDPWIVIEAGRRTVTRSLAANGNVIVDHANMAIDANIDMLQIVTVTIEVTVVTVIVTAMTIEAIAIATAMTLLTDATMTALLTATATTDHEMRGSLPQIGIDLAVGHLAGVVHAILPVTTSSVLDHADLASAVASVMSRRPFPLIALVICVACT
jgi:hypothetical protein